MAVIADFRLTDGDLPILETLTDSSGVTVTLDTMVPLGTELVPYVWVEGDHDAFERSLQTDARVESVTTEGAAGDRVLYHTRWGSEVHETVQHLGNSDPTLLRATGDDAGWRYRLRFSSHDDVAQYVNDTGDAGLEAEVQRLVTLGYAEDSERVSGLSRKQREAVELAAERGYFETPRRVTMTELAEELDISQQAVSSRIRRGVNKIVLAGIGHRDGFDVR